MTLTPQAAEASAAIQAVLTTPLGDGDVLPTDIQYMPPGRHRIQASRNGEP